MEARLTPDQTPDGWHDVAAAYDERIAPLLSRWAADAVRLAGIGEGDRVLDVACGSGAASLLAAEAGADVTAVDFAPGMVARLRERAAATGLEMRCEVMDGQALELPDGSFDAVLSNFGVIFFPAPERGLAEMRRVLAPGGRVAVTTWRPPPENALLELFGTAMREAFPDMEPPPPPGWLALGPPDAIAARLREAGFEDVRVEEATHAFEAEDPEACWRLMTETNPVMPALFDRLGDDVPRLKETVVDILRKRHGDGPVRLENAANVAVGRTP